MRKYEPYSRRELKRLRNEWLRRNPVIVAMVVATTVVTLAITTMVLMVTADGPLQWYLLGAVQVGVVASALHLMNQAFLAHNREAIWHVRGAWGEDNTRSELQKAKRRRLIWGWVDSINLRVGDLDHVVVTRHGGLIVLDSKWRSHATSDDTVEMARVALKGKCRAEGVARTLLKNESSARHRARVQSLTVTPVVVVWGPAQWTVPDGGVVRDGVSFLAGRQLVPWLRRLDGDEVPKEAARDALDRLEDFRASAWQDA